MATKYAAENAKALARLRRFVKSVTDAELKLVIYKEGWTVAVALAHLAFWDERRRVMLKLWKQEGVKQSPYVFDIINDALLPILLAIPPEKPPRLL
jgi:hypothetical protein